MTDILQLFGGPAMSPFRIAKVINSIGDAGQIESIDTRYLHLVEIAAPLSTHEQKILQSILTYGPAYGPGKAPASADLRLVVPRPGTISPWSSKRTSAGLHR